MSDDGSTVVGSTIVQSTDPLQSNYTEAFRCTSADGMQLLRSTPTADFPQSVASDVSADGQVIVGTRFGGNEEEAFRWNPTDGVLGLGFLSAPAPDGQNRSAAVAVSADGSAVYGTSTTNTDVDELFRPPFKWVQNGGMEPFPIKAAAVSSDGSIVVGEREIPAGIEAYRWTEDSGAAGLGFLPGGVEYSSAFAVSAEGDVIVGAGLTTRYHPYRWTNNGGMQLLRITPSADGGWATAVSATGDLVLGTITLPRGSSAFVWDSRHGMRALQQVLGNEAGIGVALEGWHLYHVADISSDGRSIAGTGINPNGHVEA